MGITVGDVDALMPHTIGDCQSGKAHVNQKGDMAVSQIVYSDAFYSGFLASSVHLTVEIVLADGENALLLIWTVKHPNVVLHLLTEKLRHLDDPVALGRFGTGDDILPLKPLIGFADGHGAVFKIKIRCAQRQQLPLSDTAPVKHLEGVVGDGFVHHCLGKFQVLRLCPEQHLLSLFATHIPSLGGGV